MSEKKNLTVLVDTTFIISAFNAAYPNHKVAKRYYKYFVENNIVMHLSTIVISEFQQMQSVLDLVSTNNFKTLPFNFEDALKTAEVTFNLGNNNRKDAPRAQYKDDLKLIGQAVAQGIDFIITEDESTMAKYCDKLYKAGMINVRPIVVSSGFDSTLFNSGQTTLI